MDASRQKFRPLCRRAHALMCQEGAASTVETRPSQKDELQKKPLNEQLGGIWCPRCSFFPKEHICLTPNFLHFPSQCPRFPSGSLVPSSVIALLRSWCPLRAVRIHFFISIPVLKRGCRGGRSCRFCSLSLPLPFLRSLPRPEQRSPPP